MPKLSDTAVPKYRLHRQSGQGIVTLNGRDFTLGTFNTQASKDEYDRLIREWMANGRQLPRPEEAITVSEIILAFWCHAEVHYRKPDGTPTSEQDNFRDALAPLRRLYGPKAAVEFGPLALRALREEMIRLGWCRTHINKQVSRIRGVFKWAVGHEMLPPSIFEALRSVEGLQAGRCKARESEPVKPVPEEVVEAVLPFASRHVAAMARLQLRTGMRPGEVCAMRGVDLDTTVQPWQYRPATHKTAYRGHERVIYLGPKAQEIVKPFLKPDPHAHLFSPGEAEAERRAALAAVRKTPPSCGNRAGSNRKAAPKRVPGRRYTAESYAHAIRNACRKADRNAHEADPVVPADRTVIPFWHPHQLRHTAATRLRKEHGLEAAQVILGHKNLTVTQVYAEKNVAAARQIMGQAG